MRATRCPDIGGSILETVTSPCISVSGDKGQRINYAWQYAFPTPPGLMRTARIEGSLRGKGG